MTTERVSLHAQIEELEYEIKMRRQVYPKLDYKEPRKASERALHLARMTAALRTLQWVKANEEKVRALIGGQQ